MKFVRFVFTFVIPVSTLAWAQVPFINQPLVPMSVAPGSPGFTLTVNGAGFVSSSVVQWNGTVLPTTFVSGLQLTATVPAANVAKPGTASVTVFSPAPGGGTSFVSFLQVVNPEQYLLFSASSLVGSGFAQAVVVADFNGDGKLDLATLDSASFSLAVVLGNGDGTFQASTAYPVLCAGGSPAGSLLLGDFNGDGKLDLLVTGTLTGSNGCLFFGNGDGTFQAGQSASNAYGVPAAAGDINGDGKLDLVALEPVCGYDFCFTYLNVFLGNGDGTFQAPIQTLTNLGAATSSVALADFNGDGKLDLAALMGSETGSRNLYSGTLAIALGNGDGTFQTPSEYEIGLGSTGPSSPALAVGDFNGDGRQDVLVSYAAFTGNTGGAPYIALFLGNGDGTLQSPSPQPVPSILGPVITGDFNGDGKLDAVVGGGGYGGGLLLGNGNGTFQSYEPTIPITALAVGDFNGDGKLDVVGIGSSGLAIALQTIAPLVTVAPTKLTFSTPQAIGTTSPAQAVSLTNGGNAALTITSITFVGADFDDFAQTNNCGKSLPAQATCKINVTFTPTAGGGRTSSLSISDNASGSPQTVSLAGTAQDFQIGAASQTSVTVTPGQAANYSVAVAPLNGFNQKIAFTCGGLPADSTCALTPASVTLNGSSSVNVAVAVITQAATTGMSGNGSGGAGDYRLALWCSFAGMLGLVGLGLDGRPRRSSRLRCWLLLVVLLLIIVVMPACGGGGSSGSSGTSGTPVGTYNIMVTGTYTAGGDQLVHSLKLTLLVQ